MCLSFGTCGTQVSCSVLAGVSFSQENLNSLLLGLPFLSSSERVSESKMITGDMRWRKCFGVRVGDGFVIINLTKESGFSWFLCIKKIAVLLYGKNKRENERRRTKSAFPMSLCLHTLLQHKRMYALLALVWSSVRRHWKNHRETWNLYYLASLDSPPPNWFNSLD